MARAEDTGGGGVSVTAFRHGAFLLDGRTTRFSVWAPSARRVELLLGDDVAGALAARADGYHEGVFEAPAGSRYRYLLDGRGPFADPASRSQPDGVHGPSEVVVRHRAEAVEGWRGLPLSAHVLCEVHVGTFSATGTFDGVAAALDDLAEAGYTAVELMPVAAFPGERNWGYDGVLAFAVQAGYGGRDGLARLCGAAHRRRMAVVVDVVYNHFGPDGFVLGEFGPYLTERYHTPWGKAVNFDGEGSDEVRRYFVEHALSLVRELGVDGLRLDAVHEIADSTASPFVGELAAALHAEGRATGRVHTVVAESPDDDPRLTAAPQAGGLGLDGVWNDDFHHALRVSLTGQSDRYFGDYRGVADLATASTEGFVVAGRYAPSRRRRHGARPAFALGGDHLVVFAQNHDQIGNGGFGTRLAASLPLDAQFPIAAAVLLSGWVPLRFMGEEYGETAPFHYFTDHSDAELARAVREGRRAEIGALGAAEPPDPQDPETFAMCRPDRTLASAGVHRELLGWQRLLLSLRRREPALGALEPERSTCWVEPESSSWVLVRRCGPYAGGRPVVVAATMRGEPASLQPPSLAGRTLEVLAAHGLDGVDGPGREAGGAVPGGAGVAAAGGAVTLSLAGYGVVVAALDGDGA